MLKLTKILNRLSLSALLFFIFICAACSSADNWSVANVVYSDDFSEELLVKPKNSTYYTFIKAKHLADSGKIKILIPEEVKLVKSNGFAYVAMFFDEENYGMESWSYGRVLAGDSIVLVETKFQYKTCACKTAGKFFHGYFIVSKDRHLKIRTDNKNNVYNRAEIFEVFEKNGNVLLTGEINCIDDLIFFLENINN